MDTVNLSPKFKIPIAEKELMLEVGQVPMGFQQGGLNLYSNKFKRGYGDAVFGSDENGIWLGLAEYANAPFRVSMMGELAAKSATFIDENDTTIVDAKGLISTSNFVSGSVSKTNTQEIEGTSPLSWEDVTSLSTTFTASATREVKVLFFLSMTAYYWGSIDGIVSFRLLDGSTPIGQPIRIPSHWEETTEQTVTGVVLASLSAGAHTIKVQAQVNNNGESAFVDGTYSACTLVYLALGK